MQFALAPVIDLTRNFPNADIEMMKRIGFGKHNIVQASPITYVTPYDPPFLLVHGDQYELVPYEQSQLMYDRLTQVGVSVSTFSCARQERTVFPNRAGRNLFSIPDGDLPNYRRLPGKVRVIINISKELVERLGMIRLDKLISLV